MKNRYAIVKWGLALSALFWLAFPASADQGISVNYTAPPGLFANGGGQGNSANYQQTGVLGYSFAQVNNSSANYQGGLAISGLLPVSAALSTTLSLNPTSLTFTSQNVGTSSTMQSITLTNTGSGALKISSISASGDFGQSNSCGTTLAASANCTINVNFTPTVAGIGSGNITITSNATTSPSAISLTGTGVGVAMSEVPINMVSGWNLLGNSVNATMDVATYFNDATRISTVWKWKSSSGRWAFYSPSQADGGAAYATSKGYDFLTYINGGEGFWVNSKAAFQLGWGKGTTVNSTSFANQASPTLNALPQGWSLIAVGDNPTPRSFANEISIFQPVSPNVASASVTTLWAWDSRSSNWYFYAPGLDNGNGLANYILTKGYLDFTANGKVLDPTTGFWVNHP